MTLCFSNVAQQNKRINSLVPEGSFSDTGSTRKTKKHRIASHVIDSQKGWFESGLGPLEHAVSVAL